MTALPEFGEYDEISPWAEKNGAAGLELLRTRGYNVIFNGSDIQQKLVLGWLQQRDAEIAENLAVRNTNASERSATGAGDAAKASRISAFAAIFAVVISFCALGVSILPYFLPKSAPVSCPPTSSASILNRP